MPFALITRLLTGEAGLYFARLKTIAVWYSVMAVCALILIIFLMIALFAWIASHLGVIATALIFAGLFLVLTLLAFVIARVSGRRPRDPKEDRLQRDIASIAGVTALANAPRLMQMAKQKRGLIVLPAIVVGFFGLYKFVAAIRER